MAVRPIWKGYLRLALVTCPIQLVPATIASERIRFHKLNRETGHRLRQQMVDAETHEPVSNEDTVMGYEFQKGRYVVVEKEELEKLKIESSDIITIERVVSSSALDWLYWDAPYIVEPDGKQGLDIFATIREALEKKGVAGIGRAVMFRRERPVIIQPRGKGMMLATLRGPDEVRTPEEVLKDIKNVKVDRENLSLAETLVERMEGKFDLSMFEDRYQEALQKLVAAKRKGKEFVAAEEPERPSNVVNLFDALKESLKAEGGAKSARAAKRRTSRTPKARRARKRA